ncbi:MAG: DNA polymerase III subunit delta [Deltaproteobacteria bacterium]|nr:DNA polymerase III subunit delta [Deltaproteobacteria bacterium]
MAKGVDDKLKAVYYLCGPEDFLVEKSLADIKAKALGAGNGLESFNYQSFDARSSKPEEVISAAYTLPVFAEKRLVVVKTAESIKEAAYAVYLDYLSSPSSSTALVFVSGAVKAEKTNRFLRALSDNGYFSVMNHLSGPALVDWVSKESRAQGKTISRQTAMKLISIVGTRLRDLKGELDKLALFVGDNKVIDDKDVEESGLDLRHETVYGLTDAIASKDARTAITAFDRLAGEEPLMIVGAIARQIRTLYKLRALQRKGASAQVMAVEAGVPSFFLDKNLKMSQRFTERELSAALKLLYKANLDLKSNAASESAVIVDLIIGLCLKGGCRDNR